MDLHLPQTLLRWFSQIRKTVGKLRSSRIVAAAAVIVFIGGIAISLRANPDIWSRIQLRAALPYLPLGLAAILLGGIETRLLARALGGTMDLRQSVRLTIVGSLVNLLPVPGAAMVRIAGFRAAGISLGHASGATFGAGLIWIGLATGLAGVCLISVSLPVSLIVAAGALVTFIAGLFVTARAGLSGRANAELLLVKLMVIAIEVGRHHFTLLAFGFSPVWAQSALVSSSGALGSAAVIAPGGLGIREGIAALLANASALPSEAGFLAAALDRTLLTALALCVLGALVFSRWPVRRLAAP